MTVQINEKNQLLKTKTKLLKQNYAKCRRSDAFLLLITTAVETVGAYAFFRKPYGFYHGFEGIEPK